MSEFALLRVEDDLSTETIYESELLRFERSQPALAAHVAHLFRRPLDETALSLGYFLTLALFLGFERTGTLVEANQDEVLSAEASLKLEEELRSDRTAEPFEADDVVAREQPHVLAFVNKHMEAAVEAGLEDEKEVDMDDVHAVYRTMLVLTLVLSYAVTPPAGSVRELPA